MDKNYFVVDFEFTQYNKPMGKPRGFFSEIIEIGAVMIAGDTNEITGSIQEFVKPHFYPKQAKESMEFCSITETHMEAAIDFCAMLKKIDTLYVPGKTYFVTWGNDDYRVIENSCERHKFTNPILFEDCLDLAEAYKLMNGDSYTTGLRKAAEELNINIEGHWHAAYEDAFKTGKLLLKLLADGWKPEHYFALEVSYGT
jgi:sporulation inhibitor KapD